ncbi:MAG: hypothetical protein ACK5LJ_11920 [Paracoccus sp. (in: a-proteobacteria)]
MQDPQLTLLMVPSLAVASLPLMQALHASGAEVIYDPLTGQTALATRLDGLRDLADFSTLPARRTRRIAILPAQSLYGLELPESAEGSVLIRLDTLDPARMVIRALRIEAWVLAGRAEGIDRPLPIPQSAAFRPDLDPQRFRTMIHEINIGRAMLDAALPKGIKRADWGDAASLPAEILPDLALTEPVSEPAEDLASLIGNAAALTELIREERIACPGIEPPPLPGPRLDPTRRPHLIGFVCGRNVAPYLPVLAARMYDEDVPLVYIDNDSNDGSAEIAQELRGKGILSVGNLPYAGSFSVEQQLKDKARLVHEYEPEWIMNIDADEIIECRDTGRGLHDMVSDAEARGYNAINLNEFVFLPECGENHSGRDYYAEMGSYYFFEPMPYRLLRLWRHSMGMSNLGDAGHRLTGPVRIAPESHNLRHYMALSQQAAIDKYVGRVFSSDELARNWHSNRTNITLDKIHLPRPGSPFVKKLANPGSRNLIRSHPADGHWWNWPQ